MKPILHIVNAFDPRQPYTFTFSYVGNKVVKNTLIIRKLSDNDSVSPAYSNTIESNLLQHTIPASQLQHGQQYRAKIRIEDSVGIISTYSDEVTFVCFNTPTLSFNNIQQNTIIKQSSYIFELKYNYTTSASDVVSDTLMEYQVYAYSNQNCTNELLKSNVQYTNGIIDNLSAYLQNLEKNNTYYIKAYGTTKYGMSVESEVISVSIEYDVPYIYSVLNAQILTNDASVLLTSNIVLNEGTTNDPNVSYITDLGDEYTDDTGTENGWVVIDKDNQGYTVVYENNYEVQKDYILQLRCQDIPLSTNFLTLKCLDGTTTTLSLCYSIEQPDHCYGELKVHTATTNKNDEIHYTLHTDVFEHSINSLIQPCLYTGTLCIWLQRNIDGFTFKIVEE